MSTSSTEHASATQTGGAVAADDREDAREHAGAADDRDEGARELAELASDWNHESDVEDEGRHATWLELFFDLVYALAISQLSYGLYSHLSVEGALEFVALFVPVWWAWVGVTFYETRYGCDTDAHRLLILLAMVASTAMALDLRGAFSGDTAPFALGYAAVRGVLVLLYVQAWRADRSDAVARLYLGAFTAGAVLWAVSAFVPAPWRFALWGVGLAFDLGAPLFARGAMALRPVDGTHMPERFGAFVIIVLGESVVTAGSMLTGIRWTAAPVVIGLAGFGVVASVWWTYFGLAAEGLRRVLARTGASGSVARDAYGYWHFPLVAGLVMLAVGIEIGVLHAGASHAPSAVRWTLGGGVAAYLLAVSGVHLTTSRNLRQATLLVRLATALVMLAIAAAGGGLSPVVFAVLVALVTISSAAFETAFVRRRRARRVDGFARPAPAR